MRLPPCHGGDSYRGVRGREALPTGSLNASCSIAYALKIWAGPVITKNTGRSTRGPVIVCTFLIEAIFSWPGMGSYVATGVGQLDYPVIMGVTLVSAVSFLILNTVADILLAVDPRVRLG